MSIGLETVNKEENLETVRATKQYLGKGVVALDLSLIHILLYKYICVVGSV